MMRDLVEEPRTDTERLEFLASQKSVTMLGPWLDSARHTKGNDGCQIECSANRDRNYMTLKKLRSLIDGVMGCCDFWDP